MNLFNYRSLWLTASAIPSIFEYSNPIIFTRQGNGLIINGHFKIVHVLDLTNYETMLRKIMPIIQQINDTSILKPQLKHQMDRTIDLLQQLKGENPRAKRSINWIGSAWKWIAGTPDATDWDSVLSSQNNIVTNNNQQYKINKEIMSVTNQIIKNYNKILDQINDKPNDMYEQMIFNKLSIIKEAISEIILATQLARKGITNTNLLNRVEINRIIQEVESLPYTNEVEAIEYAEPMVISKGSIILYVLSFPKTNKEEYNRISIRSTVRNNKQIYLEFKEILIDQEHIFGIKEHSNIINTTLYKNSQLQQLPKDHCISQLIRDQTAKCDFRFNENQIIEELSEDTIFLTNFQGQIISSNFSRHLNGSFIIQYFNETIFINNQTFTNTGIKTTQVLPPLLQPNTIEKNIKIELEYLHHLHLNNTNKLKMLHSSSKTSIIMDISIISIIILIIALLLLKYRNKSKQLIVIQKAEKRQENLPQNCTIEPIKLKF